MSYNHERRLMLIAGTAVVAKSAKDFCSRTVHRASCLSATSGDVAQVKRQACDAVNTGILPQNDLVGTLVLLYITVNQCRHGAISATHVVSDVLRGFLVNQPSKYQFRLGLKTMICAHQSTGEVHSQGHPTLT